MTDSIDKRDRDFAEGYLLGTIFGVALCLILFLLI
jgi:hypothetical protein